MLLLRKVVFEPRPIAVKRRPRPVELAVRAGIEIKTLTVQNTSLDDVFVHYTGRQLRDEQIKAYGYVMPPRPGMQS